MIEEFFVSAIQLCAGPYKMTNLSVAEHLIKEACLAAEDAVKSANLPHLVCLPEVFNLRAQSAEENNAAAEAIPGGHTFNWACQLASKLNIWLVAGSILEENPDSDKPFNTSFVISPAGELVAKYRKINLFRLAPDDNNQVQSSSLCEPNFRAAGHEQICFEAPWGKTGLAICFDLRFPELFVNYRKLDCNLVILPSAFTYKTGQAHWETLCKARAIENQMFFVAPNQSIEANCWGHSLIISPWGEVLATLSEEKEGFTQSKIDLKLLKKIREKLPMNRN